MNETSAHQKHTVYSLWHHCTARRCDF